MQPTANLRDDYLLAVLFYTSNAVYAELNAALRSGEQTTVKHFLPYMKLLLEVNRW